MRKFLLVMACIQGTVLSLVVSLWLYYSYSHVREVDKLLEVQAKTMLVKNGYQFYAALPEVLGSFSSAVDKKDARPEIIRQFLLKHESPFADYADTIVQASDAQEIDFRLITAIAMCESNLGKKIPADSYNAWGFAIYTGKTSGTNFEGWDHAIRVMAAYLSDKYYSRGLDTPEEIGPIYAPPSVNTGNSWAKCARKFMDELI